MTGGRAGVRTLVSHIWAAIRPHLARGRKAVKRGWERALHPSRRRTVRAQLVAAEPWDRALVLCHGNICRSPYAASVMTEAFVARGIAIPVHQGGFVGPGRRSPPNARTVARTFGINLREHRSRLVEASDLTARTLVVVMESSQAGRVIRDFGVPRSRIVVLGDLDPEPVESRDIADPWRLGPEVFDVVYRRISRCVRALADCLQQEGTGAAPGTASGPREPARPAGSGPSETPGDEALQIRVPHG